MAATQLAGDAVAISRIMLDEHEAVTVEWSANAQKPRQYRRGGGHKAPASVPAATRSSA
jgi:hypothetical protein